MLVDRYQAATSVPSARRCTVGTSASLRNQSLPVATARDSDQFAPLRSANRSVADGPFDSTQLRIVPCDDAVSCGSDDPAGAGTVSDAVVNVGGVAAVAGASAGVGFFFFFSPPPGTPHHPPPQARFFLLLCPPQRGNET